MNGKTIGENCRSTHRAGRGRDPPVSKSRCWSDAGFIVLRGNLFDTAIMKTSVISEEFRNRYLSNPKDPKAFEGRAIVFDGPEDYHHRIDDPALDIDEHCMLFMRGAGPIGYPGAAEVVNMQPPAALIKKGITRCPASATAASPAPRARPRSSTPRRKRRPAAGWRCSRPATACASTSNKGTADMLISDDEIAEAPRRAAEATAATSIPTTRRPGRKSSAAWSTSSATAWCSSRR